MQMQATDFSPGNKQTAARRGAQGRAGGKQPQVTSFYL
jgi:hypothetical protein